MSTPTVSYTHHQITNMFRPAAADIPETVGEGGLNLKMLERYTALENRKAVAIAQIIEEGGVPYPSEILVRISKNHSSQRGFTVTHHVCEEWLPGDDTARELRA